MTYFDVDFTARYLLVQRESGMRISLSAGYRYIDVDYEFKSGGFESGVDADFSGPFGGLTISR